ncbi:hypothetical protein [Parasedimentitalea psychrophila]|uniref:Uncharacterized protein n=1 Tax=Parasedimentitalea psychrophila TaxID=2997337 RepID=A0A9Y2P8J2_9RHOB|nr:hypothetical protein [Parasedimentitalea psychrophila]WIY26955.1 hypothetical protein QPJ95_08600 [Parasedimentitalea psychrophila]
MATTIKQIEAKPDVFPDIGSSDFGHDPGRDIWERVEAYCAHRWTPRQVIWTVEGDGDWAPPLFPAVIATVEVWEMGAWVETTLPDGPYGYCLPGDGPYRITATVGPAGITVDDVTTFDVPDAVAQAVRRITNYLLVTIETDTYGEIVRGPDHFATSLSVKGPGDGGQEVSFQRPSNWLAKAMQNSGAADLLRTYRRA